MVKQKIRKNPRKPKKIKRPPRVFKDSKGKFVRVGKKKIRINSKLAKNKELVQVIINEYNTTQIRKMNPKKKRNPKDIPNLDVTSFGSTHLKPTTVSNSSRPDLFNTKLREALEGRNLQNLLTNNKGQPVPQNTNPFNLPIVGPDNVLLKEQSIDPTGPEQFFLASNKGKSIVALPFGSLPVSDPVSGTIEGVASNNVRIFIDEKNRKDREKERIREIQLKDAEEIIETKNRNLQDEERRTQEAQQRAVEIAQKGEQDKQQAEREKQQLKEQTDREKQQLKEQTDREKQQLKEEADREKELKKQAEEQRLKELQEIQEKIISDRTFAEKLNSIAGFFSFGDLRRRLNTLRIDFKPNENQLRLLTKIVESNKFYTNDDIDNIHDKLMVQRSRKSKPIVIKRVMDRIISSISQNRLQEFLERERKEEEEEDEPERETITSPKTQKEVFIKEKPETKERERNPRAPITDEQFEQLNQDLTKHANLIKRIKKIPVSKKDDFKQFQAANQINKNIDELNETLDIINKKNFFAKFRSIQLKKIATDTEIDDVIERLNSEDLAIKEKAILEKIILHKKYFRELIEQNNRLSKLIEDSNIDLLAGAGNTPSSGLYGDEIYDVMEQFEPFKGVYAINQIKQIPLDNEMGFILNLDPSHKKGSHWVAVYITKDDSIEYYDSFGRQPPERFMKDIKRVIEKMKPNVYMKCKINKVVQQRANSSNCGYFAMKFLIDRFQGAPFTFSSGFNDVMKSEKNITKFKSKLKKFGYM